MSKMRSALLAIILIGGAAVAWYRWQVFSDTTPVVRPNLVFVAGGVGPYWQLLTSGAKQAASQLDAELRVMTPARDEDIDGQMQLLTQIKLDAVDGVALSPLDAEKQTPWINRAADQTFVVSVDSDAPLSKRLSYVGASNLAAGGLCAGLVKEAVPQGGKLAVLLANLTKDNTLERRAGLEEALAASGAAGDDPAPGYEVVDFLIDDGDYERCESQLTKLLDDQDDIACVVGMNSHHGRIILKVLKDLGRINKVAVVAFDTEKETLDGIERGEIYATVAQDPYQYGYEAVRLLCDYCRRSDHVLPLVGSRSTMNISTQAIKQENLDAFRKAYDKRLEAAAPATKQAG